jgi:Zn-dependent peptidase ImmA (M78 family)
VDKNKRKLEKSAPKTSQQVVWAAEELLRKHSTKIPVHILTIAKSLGITVRDEEFEEEVSGILIVQESGHVMGVNAKHPLYRRRFTIAHEIGHFVLHREQSRVFIDGSKTFNRNPESRKLNQRHEREANLFAAHLLMPEAELRNYIKRKPLDPKDQTALSRMSKYFHVSPEALTIHLGTLKLL